MLNIFQFFDFVGNVFSQMIEIHRKVSNAQNGDTNLDQIAFDFEDHLKHLAQRRLGSPTQLPAAEWEMFRICSECEAIIQKIRAALDRLERPKQTYLEAVFKKDLPWRRFAVAMRTA